MPNLNENQKRLLEKNMFVIVPTRAYKNMNEVYKTSRKNNFSIFVTTDSILHTTHLLFDYLLKTTEVDHLMGDLKQLTASLIKASLDDYKATKDDKLKKAIYTNIAFFCVAARLLNQKKVIPRNVNDVVETEIKLIKNHQGFKHSPVLGYLEDYSQYVPRGHYTRSEEFRSYFKAMMWFGRMCFYLNPSESLQVTEELTRQYTRQALLIVRALNQSTIGDKTALKIWERTYEFTTFFVGKTDDLDIHDYKNIALKIYGKIPGVKDLDNELMLNRFMSEARKLLKPKILSTFVLDIEDKKKGAQDITLGFRFMGQRFIPDSYIFQNLVYPEVMFYTGNSRPFTWVMSRRGPIRGFPRGLDIMAVLGSDYAEDIIKEEGDNEYKKYNEQLKKLKIKFNLKKRKYPFILYWNWLYCLKTLLSSSKEPLPPFMRGKAWAGKELHTALGSWVELRHDTILYAKQSYTMAGTGVLPRPQLTYGYVEPCPEVYARVREIIEQVRRGLMRGLFDSRIEDNLRRFEKLLGTLETIAEKELASNTLLEEEYKTIWNIDSTLKSITKFPHKIMSGITPGVDENMAMVTDVHTDPNSEQVLEEAVGFPFIIYVRVFVKGKDQIVQGPVFSYYEFKQPLSNRLTDEQWQMMLRTNQEPSLPEWTGKFIGKQD
jgi:hypothetical protein